MRYSATQYARALYDLVEEVASLKRNGVIRDFLDTVAKNGALSLLPEIIREFEAISNKASGIHDVTVHAPERLPEAGISRKLSFKSKVRSVRDVRLAGGIVIEVDDLRVDNSVKMRMDRIRQALVG